MGRLLDRISRDVDFVIETIAGGSKDNVIALSATAKIVVKPEDVDKVKKHVEEMKKLWDSEFMGDEPTLTVDVAENPEVSVAAFDKDSTDRVISYLIICPNGVIEYSRKLAGSVETSLNLGVV